MPDLITALRNRVRSIAIDVHSVPSRHFPNFRIETQMQSNWCWVSAVQALIGNNVPRWEHADWIEQQILAASILDQPRCRHYPKLFNRTYDLTGLLSDTTVTRGVFAGQPSPRETRSLNGRNAMVCWIEWPEGGYHYVIVSGWSGATDAELTVTVHDPREGGGTAEVSYFGLCDAYDEAEGEVAFRAVVG